MSTNTPPPAPGLDAWSIDPLDFPGQDAPAADVLRFLLRYAVLAPSNHNSQPWLFRVDEERVDIYADRLRALPVVDPEDRELTMSCGAALLHLRLAARCYLQDIDVELLPDPEAEDLLASVRLAGLANPTDAERVLFGAIPQRRTNRQAFEMRPVPLEIVDRLAEEVAAEGATLTVVRDEIARSAVAELIAEADRRQGASRSFRRELAAWIHAGRSRSRDGMPGYAQRLTALKNLSVPLLVRTFAWGRGQAARDRQLAEGSPVLAVLSTPADDARAWLQAGQAMARLLLRATAEGISASFLNQPVEVSELRGRLADLLVLGQDPQLVVRLGYAPAPAPTPRRPVGEVLLATAPD